MVILPRLRKSHVRSGACADSLKYFDYGNAEEKRSKTISTLTLPNSTVRMRSIDHPHLRISD